MRWIGIALREILLALSNSPQSRWRQIHRLRDLDGRLLDDIAVTRRQVMEQRALLPGSDKDTSRLQQSQRHPPPLRHEPQGALKPWH